MRKKPITMGYDEKYLLSELEQTKFAMDAVFSNFENVVDPDLIDCYIYELKAVQKRYKYLLERAKQADITCETVPGRTT